MDHTCDCCGKNLIQGKYFEFHGQWDNFYICDECYKKNKKKKEDSDDDDRR